MRQWPLHLAAQLNGLTSTRILGPQTDLLLPPLPQEEAKHLLTELMAHWLINLNEPLPLACKTACIWLTDNKDREKAARDAYEGGFQRFGEVSNSQALARLWPDFDALFNSGNFDELSRTLYEPMIQQCGKQTVAEDEA